MNIKFLLFVNFIFIVLNILILSQKLNFKNDEKPYLKEIQYPEILGNIDYSYEHQSYEQIISTLKEWEYNAPDLVEVGTYGKSTKQQDLFYLKISNEHNPSNKKVLITACIHGNEPWSTSTIMSYAHKMISSYGKDQDLTQLLNERTIYIIPVVSPDSYAAKRHVDGVDPNRDFPTVKNPDKISVAPVKKLQDFFLEIKPNSVLSGHTYGRIFLIPWGYTLKDNPNSQDYERIASNMAKLADYDYQKASELYGKPIYGTEIDWYHRNGSFAMVMEFGTHQKNPSKKETLSEFERTFKSFIYFLKESVDVEIRNSI